MSFNLNQGGTKKWFFANINHKVRQLGYTLLHLLCINLVIAVTLTLFLSLYDKSLSNENLPNSSGFFLHFDDENLFLALTLKTKPLKVSVAA